VAIPAETTTSFAHFVGIITRGIEIAGIAMIVLGALAATASFLARLRHVSFADEYRVYRANLGRVILIGLELLVAADIIGTVAVEPTFRSLGVLAAIVLIRTFLSFSLEVEIAGHWPWQESRFARLESRPDRIGSR
jgi:uncharacterized membrane protein